MAEKPPVYAEYVALVDVVVVSYNSREHLRAAVEPVSNDTNYHGIVVDNGSSDGSVDSVADLPLDVIRSENLGFAHGCNLGWRAGEAPFVLFLNPDATIDRNSVLRLVRVTEEPAVGAAAPEVVASRRRAALLAAPVSAPAVALRAGVVPAPRLSGVGLERRADPHAVGLRGAWLTRLGLGSVLHGEAVDA